jgi:hypothetical protein
VELTGKALPDAIKMVRQTPYAYEWHFASQDIEGREVRTGKSRWGLPSPAACTSKSSRSSPGRAGPLAVVMIAAHMPDLRLHSSDLAPGDAG